ncbi:hypothetical protein F4703DRAFT_1838950 [Phycomyces blakesleeanus]
MSNKGHRSSQCCHTDRHLLPIRRKGRPASQCEKCREQRQKKSIHQKCACHKKTSVEPGLYCNSSEYLPLDRKQPKPSSKTLKPLTARQKMAIATLLM